MSADFTEWLRQEMRKRAWNQAQLAAAAGISESGLTYLLNGTRQPGPKVCRALARALGYPQWLVFYRAGLLTEKPEGASEDVPPGWHRLPPDEQDDLAAFIRRRARRARGDAP